MGSLRPKTNVRGLSKYMDAKDTLTETPKYIYT